MDLSLMNVCMSAPFDASVYRFVLLMLVSLLLLLLFLLLEFRYESFYSRQSSNIVYEATHYIGRYASKANDPNSPIVTNKTRGKQIATNQSKSKTNLIYAILGLHATDTIFIAQSSLFFLSFSFAHSFTLPIPRPWLVVVVFDGIGIGFKGVIIAIIAIAAVF